MKKLKRQIENSYEINDLIFTRHENELSEILKDLGHKSLVSYSIEKVVEENGKEISVNVKINLTYKEFFNEN